MGTTQADLAGVRRAILGPLARMAGVVVVPLHRVMAVLAATEPNGTLPTGPGVAARADVRRARLPLRVARAEIMAVAVAAVELPAALRRQSVARV